MEGNLMQTKQMKILVSLAVFMAVLMMGSFAALNFEKISFLNPSPAVISVSGKGEVVAVPDIGQFTFSVKAEGEDAMLVQEESGTRVNDVIAYLKDQGIEEKDIKTISYNMYPRYKWEQQECVLTDSRGYCPPGERVQDGFEVSQTIQVKVRDTSEAGAIIAGVGERGVTNISGLNFTIDDVESLQDEAREKAIDNAKVEAELLASQLGVKLVRLVSFNESGGNGYYPIMETRAMALDMDLAEESAFGGAEMPTGEQTTTANVTLVYEVR